MKKNSLLLCMLLVFFWSAGLWGCAQVQRNQAQAEYWRTERQSQYHIQLRNDARNSNILSALSEGGRSADLSTLKNAGHFPVIFINDSRRNRSLIIEKKGLSGEKWNLDLQAHSFKEFSFEAGEYLVRWKVPGSGTLYPQKGPQEIKITENPRFFYERTGQRYHGGLMLDD